MLAFISDIRAVAQFCEDIDTIATSFNTLISVFQGETPDEKPSLELHQNEEKGKEGKEGKDINDPPASAGNV